MSNYILAEGQDVDFCLAADLNQVVRERAQAFVESHSLEGFQHALAQHADERDSKLKQLFGDMGYIATLGPSEQELGMFIEAGCDMKVPGLELMASFFGIGYTGNITSAFQQH